MKPQFTFNSLKRWNFYFTLNYEDEWGGVNLRDGPETMPHSKVFLSAEVRKRRHTQDLAKGGLLEKRKNFISKYWKPSPYFTNI